MKKSKSKERGFTLIELMVVISIISLLSSVVLASVKSAREKAQITKTVAEMKSLQTAIELYRNQFGVYPGFDAYDCGNACQPATSDNFKSVMKTSLVNNKFISKIPQSINYPNNCEDGYCSFGDMFMYQYINPTYIEMWCGENKVLNYYIGYQSMKKINLPEAYYYYQPNDEFVKPGFMGNPYPDEGTPKVYCISG